MLARLPLLVALAVAPLAAAPPPETEVFVLERLNGTYTDLGGDVREVRNGPVIVRPRSESNRFELHANRLELTPLGEGEHRAELWVRFEGEADVAAEILVGSLSGGTLTDEVTVPEQERTLESRIELERRGEDYVITILEAPRDFSIHIRSRLAGQLVSICESLTLFAPGDSCEGLDVALSNPRLPMPEPGKELLLPAAQLRPEEAAQLDAYLERASRAQGE